MVQLSPRLAQLRQMAECDLLSGMVGLAAYAKHGPPESVKASQADARRDLFAVLTAIGPKNLSGGFSSLWRAAEPLWRGGQEPDLHEILRAIDPREKSEAAAAVRLVERYGMGIPFYSKVAARKILQVADGLGRMRAAQKEMTDAYKQLETHYG